MAPPIDRKRRYVTNSNEPKKSAPKKTSLLGIGLDNDDGHTRLTRGRNFALVGGSEETHSIMQESAIKINERVDKSGRKLEDVSAEELREICRDVIESVGRPRRNRD